MGRGLLLVAMLLAMVVGGRYRILRGRMRPGAEGAVWMHGWCRRLLRLLGVEARVEGVLPEKGAVVCNHLSYLDVLVLSAARPFVMVAKAEVRGWPLFGWLTAQAGTVYVTRGAPPATYAGVNEAMRQAYATGLPVIFFPEGTTTDGSAMMPFRRGLFHSVLNERVPLRTAAVRYAIDAMEMGRTVAKDVCWWGEMTLVPHLWRLLGMRGVAVTLTFGVEMLERRDRFALASAAREAVAGLYGEMAGRGPMEASARVVRSEEDELEDVCALDGYRSMQD